jgi:hypothetical protein
MTQQHRRVLSRFGAAFGLLVLSFAVACGGGSSETAKDAPGKSGDAGKAATAVQKAASPAADKGAPAKGSDSDFANAFSKFKTGEFKIEYELSITGPGAMTGTMTIRQLAGKTRTDMSTAQGSFILIQDGAKAYMCLADQRMCLDAGALGGSGPVSSPVLSSVQDFATNAGTYTNRQLDTRTIAGIRATCYEVTSTKSEKSTTCVGPDGQMLLGEFTGGGITSKITATKVEGKPPASDFEPPYPVQSLGGLGGPGGGIPGGFPTPPAR